MGELASQGTAYVSAMGSTIEYRVVDVAAADRSVEVLTRTSKGGAGHVLIKSRRGVIIQECFCIAAETEEAETETEVLNIAKYSAPAGAPVLCDDRPNTHVELSES